MLVQVPCKDPLHLMTEDFVQEAFVWSVIASPDEFDANGVHVQRWRATPGFDLSRSGIGASVCVGNFGVNLLPMVIHRPNYDEGLLAKLHWLLACQELVNYGLICSINKVLDSMLYEPLLSSEADRFLNMARHDIQLRVNGEALMLGIVHQVAAHAA